jgi:gluconokinase
MIVVVMGVSGCGKTTLGRLLAARLGCTFLDGDDFHPPANIAKMAAGIPLDDADRRPWLTVLNAKLRGEARAVLACSALKQSYRDALAAGIADCRIVHLRGDIALIRVRLGKRRHRYMPASLLESQFAALEPPRDGIEIDVSATPEECVAAALLALARR